MQSIQTLIKSDIDLLNQTIRNDLGSSVPLVNNIADYIIVSGGKRLRPLITILCGNLLGVTDKELLAKMATMIEYIHTATLLHDDVVDDSGMRRGRKTANAVFGNPASVLVGDFIYTRAFQLMVQSSSLRLLSVMADITNVISEGEVLQLLNIGNDQITEEDYYKVIESKTAKLFEAGAIVASILANATEAQENALIEYTIALGTAFQIADDVLDYIGDSDIMGKNVGDDLIEGKVTLPLIYAIQDSDSYANQTIKSAIANPKSADLAVVLDLIIKSGAIDKTKEKARMFASKAISALDIFPAGEYKNALINLANYSIERIQ